MKRTRKMLSMLVAAAAVITVVLRRQVEPVTVAGAPAASIVGGLGLLFLCARIGFTVLDVKRGTSPSLRWRYLC